MAVAFLGGFNIDFFFNECNGFKIFGNSYMRREMIVINYDLAESQVPLLVVYANMLFFNDSYIKISLLNRLIIAK